MFKRNQKIAKQQELYQLHYRRIYNTCLRIVGNPMDAEEAMHDTFLKLFDRIDDLQNEKAFLAWSRSIAVSTSIDRIRKRKLVFYDVYHSLTDADEIATECDPFDEPIELSVETIKQALSSFPDGYRIILTMRLFEECEFSEIAQLLGITESTVRSQFARGRKKLAEKLT